MAPFTSLVRFESSDSKIYFANLDAGVEQIPATNDELLAFESFDDLQKGENGKKVVVSKILSPLPRTDIPIYCVGLNYKSHADEASMSTTQDPAVWVKPSAALADPNEDIPISAFCAETLDSEGEFVFVTSRECKNVSVAEAQSYILGYTVGNDITCRMHQAKERQSGQFFFAKAFDKFAPIGPILRHSSTVPDIGALALSTRINGHQVQHTVLGDDMIFSPAQILSHMSQGTTIPAFTAVMTGTPAGVGYFRDPKTFLDNGDVIEVQVDGIPALRSRIRFETI